MKNEIRLRIEKTKETIMNELDSFIMDTKTNTYNETFLLEYLKNYLRILDLEENKRNLILMILNVDNMTNINVKYSNEKGDETIKNLGYLISQIKEEDDILFKRKAPGYWLLIHDYKGKDIKEYASLFQTRIKNSEAFIELISVSISISKLQEIDQDLSYEEKAQILLAKANARINISHELSDNSFIDNDNINVRKAIGSVLIIDSDTLMGNILKTYFEKNNYKVETAKDGVTAVNIAKRKQFNAIIADRYTHKFDGFLIKQYLNESSINMTTPFILLIQSKSVNVIEKVNHLGINYVLEKPIIFEEILGIVEREMTRKSPG